MTAQKFCVIISDMRNVDLSTMMTTAEAAQELGVTQRRVVQLIATGLVSGCIEVGGSYLIPREQVEAAKARPKVGSKRKKQA